MRRFLPGVLLLVATEPAWAAAPPTKLTSEERATLVRGFALNAEGFALLNKGRYPEAEKPLREALAIRLKVHGELHADTAISCSHLATCLQKQDRLGEALPLYQRALAICQKVHGELHCETAACYNNVAFCLNAQAKPVEALPLFQRALDIYLKVLGEHPFTAQSYKNVAFCLDQQGKPGDALPLCRRALAIDRQVHGEQHPQTALSYNNLACCLNRLGKHGEAWPLFQRALDIERNVHGELRPDTAIGYSNLAYCLNCQGKSGEALPLAQRALAISVKVLGARHRSSAACCNVVGHCLNQQGKPGEALALYRRALDIWLKLHGEQHPATAQSYENVAHCLNYLGKHEEALALGRRTLAIRLKLHGELNPETAQSYNNVAMCLDQLAKQAEALPLFRRALAIRQKVYGEQHPQTAQSYNNVAMCLDRLTKHVEALASARRALAIYRQVHGEQHPQTAISNTHLAWCLYRQGRRAEGLRLLQASLPDQEAARFHTASTGFDRALASTRQASPHALLAAGLARMGQPGNALRHAEMALARGLLDDLAAVDAAQRQRLAGLSTQLSALGQRLVPLLGAATLSPEQASLREQLLQRRRALEAQGASLASALSAQQVLGVADIQRHISADVALVLWIDALGEYLGCVLRHQGPPAWVILPASGKQGIWTNDDAVLSQRCYVTLTDPSADDAVCQALYRQRLAPLEKHLAGVKHLLVVPTGALVKVPVEALTQRWTVSYVPSGTAFACAAALPSRNPPSKALVLADPVFTATSPKEPPAPPHGLLVKAVLNSGLAARVGLRAGDVLLSYAGKALKSPEDLKEAEGDDRVAIQLWREGQSLQRRIPAGKLGIVVDKRPIGEALAAWRDEERKLLASARGPDWTALPGTRLEARTLAALLPGTRLLLGSAASEQSLERLAGADGLKRFGLLHLATHGQANPSLPRQTAMVLAQDQLPSTKEQEARVLAGKKPLEGRLTVETVLHDWRLDADLVTLSACQTGLGAQTQSEGMLGFAQALLQKGARSVLLARWKVDDSATALLMVRFYENLLGKRAGLKAPLSKAEALHEAKQWLRTLSRQQAELRLASLVEGVPRGERGSLRPALPARKADAAKEERPFAHPYYWAAFVLLGDPR
jgi:CHAT domain-containing protein/Tfp pilus assembly protein PilF